MSGWVKLHRKLADHWLWKQKPFSYGQAWVDIIMECNHSDQKVLIGGELITCKRGESINSLDTWAKRWGWNKSKVRRFISLLKTDTMVVQKPTLKTTHLRVCNYEAYQNERNADETQMKRKRNADDTRATLNKNVKNDKNEKNDKELSDSFSLWWDQYGKKTGKAKSFKKWKRLTNAQRAKCLEVVKDYVDSTPDVRFRKNPLTYLNGEHWDDEINKLSEYDYDSVEF